MSNISYLQLCRYINKVKSLNDSKEKTKLLVELTALVNWSVDHEEIRRIPVKEKFLLDVTKLLDENNITVESESQNNELEEETNFYGS